MRKTVSPIVIKKESVVFLKILSKNNNRDWFNKHKEKYIEANNNIVAFADALLFEMNKHDKIETSSGKAGLFRIYKDVRFSKDKTPYNTHWSGVFKRATEKLRGGYYFNIKPGGSILVGGFWGKHEFTEKEVCSPDFLFKANDVFKKMRPFLDYMSEVLTTDANGVSLID